MRRALLIASLVWCIPTASACVGGSCPEAPEDLDLASGTLESTGERVSEPRTTPFPHGPEAKTMEVDREAQLVRIRYERGGQTYVETWRIAAVE